MKKMSMVSTGVILIGLLAGCSQAGNFASVNANAQTQDLETLKTGLERENEPILAELGEEYYYETNEEVKSEGLDTIEDIISSFNWTMHQGADEKYIEMGFNDDYHRYLEAMALKSSLRYFETEDNLLRKDTDNLRELTGIIIDGHILGEKQPKKVDNAVLYVQQLLNDLDIKINGINGDLSGFSYEANGEKTGEIENFLKK